MPRPPSLGRWGASSIRRRPLELSPIRRSPKMTFVTMASKATSALYDSSSVSIFTDEQALKMQYFETKLDANRLKATAWAPKQEEHANEERLYVVNRTILSSTPPKIRSWPAPCCAKVTGFAVRPKRPPDIQHHHRLLRRHCNNL
jgi:hypothetical protein